MADFDVIELMSLLTQRCVDVLEVDAAGLMLVGPDGNLRVMASSSEAIRVLELFELQSQEGPCLDCRRSGLPVVNQDHAAADSRRPRFAAEALTAGFHSVHALPLRMRGTVIGALNLFHLQAGQMPPADVDSAQALADVATIAILQHRAALEAQVVNEQLNHALNSRIVIEQAKGIVAQRQGLNMEQAFSTLGNHARTHNLPWSTSPTTSSTAPRRLRPHPPNHPEQPPTPPHHSSATSRLTATNHLPSPTERPSWPVHRAPSPAGPVTTLSGHPVGSPGSHGPAGRRPRASPAKYRPAAHLESATEAGRPGPDRS